MAADRHRRTVRTAAAAAALTAAVLTGCGAVDRTLDCVRTADSVADGVTDLQQAVENAAGGPARADAALTAIDEDLRALGDRTRNADVNRAVDHLTTAAGTVRTALDTGDRTPDLTPVTDAAGELTKVCTP
ncbi:hypothetical protein [Streptomyces tropicalis]|uniref:Secreted protein n=1 Tax=Streptomyces tropicalis TaxID=3034234 RepID=A0ABT5ZZA4_9ACTN|nr:hypothetical protein [Streptomyces tropicalis]MDF3297721.1 hypothetical protein [Streptomyces tropicalis]